MPISIVLSLIWPLGSALAFLPLHKGRQWIYLPGQAQHVIFTRDSESIQHSPFLHLWKRKLRVGRRCGCPILDSHPGCPSSLPPHHVTSPCPLLLSLSGEGAMYPEASLAWIASAFLLVCLRLGGQRPEPDFWALSLRPNLPPAPAGRPELHPKSAAGPKSQNGIEVLAFC